MAETKTPSDPYPLKKWLKQPKGAVDEEPYDKYLYKNGETLESIARVVSKPWKRLKGQDITAFNWGAADTEEINFYLKEHNGCKYERGIHYLLSEKDTNPFVWVPRLVHKERGKYRSPGKEDVGHVALDDPKDKKHVDTLVIRPVYTIALELGDIDAIFDPMGDASSPHTSKGVQERLQVLGYLYAPLDHTKINDITKEVWEHYRKLNTPSGQPEPRNPALLAILKREVQSNLLAVVKDDVAPKAGACLDGRLPEADEFGMIRFPGGYCFNFISATDKYTDPAHKYTFGNCNRHDIEQANFDKNPLLGKIPLVATVHKVHPDGRREVADGVSVYFQLVKPPELADDDPVKAPDLRGVELNFGKNRHLAAVEWPHDGSALCGPSSNYSLLETIAKTAVPKAGAARTTYITAEVAKLTSDPGIQASCLSWITAWARMMPIAQAAVNVPDAPARNTQIDTAVDSNADIPAPDKAAYKGDIKAWVTAALAERNKPDTFPQAPDTTPRGPKKFVEDRVNDAYAKNAANADDPQKNNCDKDFGGKRRIPVEGTGSDDGVFQVDKIHDGLHNRRSDKHADYGTMTAAKKVTPKEEDDGTGTTVKKHAHAVRAKTNDKGHAGVIFMPARCGGDKYRLRAYVGPETLEFDGRDPEGPVVETGTMVVWRNIRLHRYIQIPVPPKAGVSQAVKDIFPHAPNVNTFEKAWKAGDFDSGVGQANMGTTDTPSDKMAPGTFGNKNYRPIEVQCIGLGQQYRRAYCELVIDADKVPEKPTAKEMSDAFDAGLAQLAGKKVNGKDVVWNQLMFYDATSPWMINVRQFGHYNTLSAATPANQLAAGDLADIQSKITFFVMEFMLFELGGGGIMPGLTLVYSGRGSTWDYVHPTVSTPTTSGVALSNRAAFLWYTRAIYKGSRFPYSLSSNAAHELGHAKNRTHQPTVPNNGDADTHESPSQDHPCIMSYRGGFGDYCGRCILALRGWKTKSSLAGSSALA